MKKIDWKPIGEFMGQVGEAALYVLAFAATLKVSDYMTDIPDRSYVGYDDAVSAIMKSSMYSHDKSDAAVALKRGESSDYYKAVVHIVSDPKTFSHDKVNMIKYLSE